MTGSTWMLGLQRKPFVAVAMAAALVASTLGGAIGASTARAAAANSIVTVAGGGSLTNDDVSALSAAINPGNVAVDAAGDLFILDNNKVREVPAASGTQFGVAMTAGNIYTVAGNGYLTGGPFSAGGVPATSIPLNEPAGGGLAVDAAGNLFIAVSGSTQIMGVNYSGAWLQEVANQPGTHFGITMQAGYIYTVAGNGKNGSSGDGGPALSASFDAGPIAVDGSGNVYIGANGVIREVAATSGTAFGITMSANDIYTVAGNGTTIFNQIGNGVPALSAPLGIMSSLAVDSGGDIFIGQEWGQFYNDGIVQVVAATSGTRFGVGMTSGDIYLVAGNGSTDSDGVPATNASYNFPSISTDAAGNLFIADYSDNFPTIANVVREVPAATGTQYGVSMTAGNIYDVAGNRTQGFSGDGGPALSAQLNLPHAEAVDSHGNLFIADQGNSRVREVAASGTSQLAISGTVTALSNGQTVQVDGALVQACSITTGACTPNGILTDSQGDYALIVPDADSYRVNVYPGLNSTYAAASTDPIAVTAPAGASGVNITLEANTPLPADATLNGVTGQVPVLNWQTPAPFTVQGCPNGAGSVSISGVDTGSGNIALTYVNLVETPAGSGNYTATIPPLYPMHGTSDIQYVVDCTPQSAVTPAFGPPSGGNTVTLTGQGFAGATNVLFGAMPATSFTVQDDGTITATVPPGAGSVAVSVITPSGTITSNTLATYSYLSVDSLSETTGSAGDTVTITGTNLSAASALYFGDTPVDTWSVNSDTQISAVVPPGTGTVDVTLLTSGGGTSGTASVDQFTYAGSALAAARDVAARSSLPDTRQVRSLHPAAAKGGPRPHSGRSHVTVEPDVRAHSSSQGFLPNAKAGWAAMAALILARLANVAVNACANGKDFKTELLQELDKYLDSVRANPYAYLVGNNSVADNLINTGIVSAAVLLAAPFITGAAGLAAVAAGVAVLLALPAILDAINNLKNNPNLQKCLKKQFPPKTVKAPQTCQGKFCPKVPIRGKAKGKIDPSGTVLDTNGNPIAGATVTLLRSDSASGPFVAPPMDSPDIDPALNPETTGTDGAFHWDVVAGYYEIQAAAPGCADPANSVNTTVSSPVLPVPPPQVGLTLTLRCPSEPPAQAPTVTGVSLATGPSAGGNTVLISGTGFTPGSTVLFGAVPAAAASVLSLNTIQATAPPGTGTVDVSVTNGAGPSSTGPADQYTYTAPPAVTALSRSHGPAVGGTPVTITGSGFDPGAEVLFGSVAATAVTVLSPSTLLAVAPPGSGTVDIQVSTQFGTSVLGPADRFTYDASFGVTTTSLPAASIGVPYAQNLAAAGGQTPYRWSILKGSLPAGLTLSSSGTISGTPVVPEVASFTVGVSDGSTPTMTAAMPLSLTVGGCTTTITGPHSGPLTLRPGATCLAQAQLNGPLKILSGAIVAMQGVQLNGPLVSSGAGTFAICGSRLSGPVVLHGGTGSILAGNGSDDGAVGCSANQFSGGLAIDSARGGVEISGNRISGPVALLNTIGSASETGAIELEGNHLDGPLLCIGNSPAPTTDGQPNTGNGPALGQCAGFTTR